MAILLAALLLQEDVAALVRKLGSEAVEERDDARRGLKALGQAALPELERAAKEGDVEVAARARELVRAIDLFLKFSPAFRKAFPDVEDRLASGADAVWTKLFLEACSHRDTSPWRFRFAPSDFEPLALRALRGASADKDRETICRKIGSLGLKSAAAEVRERLRDKSPDVRSAAAGAAGRLGDREAIPGIARLLENAPRSAFIYFEALEELQARTELRDLLSNPVPDIRCGALLSLADLGSIEDEALLRKALRDPESLVRGIAITALARFLGEKATGAAIQMLEDPEPDARHGALSVLRKRPAKEAIPTLLKVLGSPMDAPQAAEILAALQVPEGKLKLLEILRDPEHTEREEAISVVGRVALKEAIPDLRGVLKSSDPALRKAAVKVLTTLSGKAAIADLRALLKDPDHGVLAQAIDALVNLDALEAIDELATMVDHAAIGGAALAALGHLGARDRIPLLVKALSHVSPSQRIVAIRTLQKLGATEEVPKIRERLEDANPGVRKAAIEALGRFSLREAVPDLEKRLTDDDDMAANAAAAWLCTLGSRAGARLLLEDGGRQIAFLNALRAPLPWARMTQRVAQGEKEGTQRELVEELARQGGSRIEWPKMFTKDQAASLAIKGSLNDLPPRDSLNLMEHLEHRLTRTWSLILEEDRIRVVSQMEAGEFWEAWVMQDTPK